MIICTDMQRRCCSRCCSCASLLTQLRIRSCRCGYGHGPETNEGDRLQEKRGVVFNFRIEYQVASRMHHVDMKYLCDDFGIFWIVRLCVDQLSSDWQTQPWCFSILSEETTSRETTSSKKWDKKFLCQEDRMDRHIGFKLLSFRCVCIEPQPTGARRRSPQAALAKM